MNTTETQTEITRETPRKERAAIIRKDILEALAVGVDAAKVLRTEIEAGRKVQDIRKRIADVFAATLPAYGLWDDEEAAITRATVRHIDFCALYVLDGDWDRAWGFAKGLQNVRDAQPVAA